MAEHRFDELAKALAQGVSRREALRRLGGGLAGAVLASVGLGKAWGDPGGNSACAHWCSDIGNPLHCTSDAAHGQGLCYQCGPAAPAGHPDVCSAAGVGPTCCSTTASTCCSGRCTNLATDVTSCGQCGLACAPGQGCCNGQCTDLTTTSNCGTCGNTCGSGQVCLNGACWDTCTNPGGMVGPFCWCGPTVEGQDVSWSVRYCVGGSFCQSSADCGPGRACFSGCCAAHC